MKQSDIERLLPAVFQRTITEDNVLHHLLDVMEYLHAPTEEILRYLDAFFDPYRAPDDFVRYLAVWLDLAYIWEADTFNQQVSPFPPQIRLRELVAEGAYLSRWRGTAQGLQRYLEVATGIDGYRVSDQQTGPDGQPIPFHIAIYAPERALHFQPIIQKIIQNEKPVYVTYELHIGDVEVQRTQGVRAAPGEHDGDLV